MLCLYVSHHLIQNGEWRYMYYRQVQNSMISFIVMGYTRVLAQTIIGLPAKVEFVHRSFEQTTRRGVFVFVCTDLTIAIPLWFIFFCPAGQGLELNHAYKLANWTNVKVQMPKELMKMQAGRVVGVL